MKILNLAEESLDISFKELENIIKIDPGLTSKILKIANSALYARQTEIKSLQMAITLLGFKNIKSLILLITASSFFKKHKDSDFYNSFWKHAIFSAFIGKKITIFCQQKELSENVFLSALLHNMGKIALYNYAPELYQKAISEETNEIISLEELEEKYFKVNHKIVGSELFKKWNFPDIFVDTSAEHDSVNITSPFKVIIIYVSVAGLLSDKLGFGFYSEKKDQLLKQLLKHTNLKPEYLDYFENQYLTELQDDPLFIQCQSLFNIQKLSRNS
ncbi:MAG: HDOD domain-containing protein [Spirochaetales bacterium]|nr:HDOD domain-containing protein [Spirochaetales bacterium]